MDLENTMNCICQKQKGQIFMVLFRWTIWHGWIHKRKDILQIIGVWEEEAMELFFHGSMVSAYDEEKVLDIGLGCGSVKDI